MSKPRFPVVFVDADETIFDFYLSEETAILRTCDAFGIKADKSDVAVYSRINDSLWKELEKNTLTREELRTERFLRWFEYLSVKADPVRFDVLYADNLSNCGFLIDKAEEFLSELSEICDVYIVTNGLTRTQRDRLSASPVSKYITKMYVSEEIGFAKPDKRYFDYIFDDLKIEDKSRVIILGDSLTSDMQGGRNAGITTCLYKRHIKESLPSLCDYSISSYDEFFDIIQNDPQ